MPKLVAIPLDPHRGRALYVARIDAGLSLLDAASMLGLNVAALANLETGRLVYADAADRDVALARLRAARPTGEE